MNYNKENNGFEDFIKDSFENYEVEYNPSHWIEIEQKLESTSSGSSSKTKWFISSGIKLTAIAGLIISGVIYFYSLDKEVTAISQENTKAKQINSGLKPANKKAVNPENKIEIISNDKSEIKNSQIKDETKSIFQEYSNLSLIKSEVISIERIVDQSGENNGAHIKDEIKQVKPATQAIINSNFIIDHISKCELTTQFIIEKFNENYSYEWDFGDGNTSKSINPKHQYKSPGIYNVVLTVSGKENIKPLVAKKQLIIDPITTPNSNFEWKAFDSGSLNYGAEFIIKESNATEWTWSFGDNQFSNEKNPSHIYLSKGNYEVKLITKNHEGCTDTVTKMIVLKENNPLFAPNGFSPDGDGLNDTFIPKALETSNNSFEMLIYDRSGSLVFKTNNVNYPWDGRNAKSGDQYSNGTTFLWVVTIRSTEQEDKTFFGNITIIK